MFKDLIFVVKASGITFGILFIILTLSLIYEHVTQKAIFDAQDNIGTDVVYKAVLGDELFDRYNAIVHELPDSVASLILTDDINQFMTAYEAIQDLHQFEKASDQLNMETGFRDIISKRLDMLEDPSYVKVIQKSFYRYSRDDEYHDCTPELRQKKIEKGIQPNGYNINDPFYELKSQLSVSDQFEKLALDIVREATPNAIRTELFN